MRALVFDSELRIEDQPKPARSGRECLIRLLKAGICNTDLEITKGYFGFTGVLGHEFVGVVEAAPTASLVGQRVVGEINAACQACEYCQKGLQRHCPERTVLGILKRDGAFREFLTLPEENLHVVPESIPMSKLSSLSRLRLPAKFSIRYRSAQSIMSPYWATASLVCSSPWYSAVPAAH